MKDFYYILGVSPESTLLEIIEAYEKLSPKFDPVLNGHDRFYTKQFNEVREAFHVLTDPAKRKQYNEQLKSFNTSLTVTQPKKSLAGSIAPKIDVTFSLILILLTGVFGSYVYRSVYQHSKKAPVTNQPIVNTPPAVPLITRHQQKRYIKHKARLVAKTSDAVEPVTVAATPVKTNVPVAYPAAKASIPVTYAASKPAVVSKPQPVIEEEPLNEAEVRANETGVVYLREYAQFGAPVIKTLQDHAKIIILEKGNKYYRIQSDDQIGYIPKWAVKLSEQE